MFHFRFLLIAAIIIVGLALGLSSFKISSSQVDLDATAQALSVRAAGEAIALDPFLVTSAVFYGSGQIGNSSLPTQFQSSFAITRLDAALPLMTLQALTLEPGTALKIKKLTGSDRAFEFVLESASPRQLIVFAQGRLQAEIDGSVRQFQSLAPQPFRINVPAGQARLALTFAEPEWVERRPFRVGPLSFFDSGEKDGVPFKLSALDGGHVRFSEIELDDGKNKELELRSGQPFFIQPVSTGIVRLLKLSKEGISLQYSGEVANLGTGWDDAAPTSHMPSYLSFIASKDWVKQALSALIAALGLYLALLQVRAARIQK